MSSAEDHVHHLIMEQGIASVDNEVTNWSLVYDEAKTLAQDKLRQFISTCGESLTMNMIQALEVVYHMDRDPMEVYLYLLSTTANLRLEAVRDLRLRFRDVITLWVVCECDTHQDGGLFEDCLNTMLTHHREQIKDTISILTANNANTMTEEKDLTSSIHNSYKHLFNWQVPPVPGSFQSHSSQRRRRAIRKTRTKNANESEELEAGQTANESEELEAAQAHNIDVMLRDLLGDGDETNKDIRIEDDAGDDKCDWMYRYDNQVHPSYWWCDNCYPPHSDSSIPNYVSANPKPRCNHPGDRAYTQEEGKDMTLGGSSNPEPEWPAWSIQQTTDGHEQSIMNEL